MIAGRREQPAYFYPVGSSFSESCSVAVVTMMVFANSRCLQLCVVLLAKVNVRWSRLGSQPRVDGDGSDSGGKKRWG